MPARASTKQLAALAKGRRKLKKIRELEDELCRLTGRPRAVACSPARRKAAAKASTPRSAPAVRGRAHVPSTEDRLLVALHKVAARDRKGALLLVRTVRAAATDLSKLEFDQAANALSRADRIVLHHHDSPSRLSPEERAQLVADEHGTYYVGIAPRAVR